LTHKPAESDTCVIGSNVSNPLSGKARALEKVTRASWAAIFRTGRRDVVVEVSIKVKSIFERLSNTLDIAEMSYLACHNSKWSLESISLFWAVGMLKVLEKSCTIFLLSLTSILAVHNIHQTVLDADCLFQRLNRNPKFWSLGSLVGIPLGSGLALKRFGSG
jgi:hypothetical protein